MTRNRVRNHVMYLYKQQDGKCYYCGKEMVLRDNMTNPSDKMRLATFDHIVTRAAGGTYARTNGVCACRLCNQTRGDMKFEEFIENFDEVMKQRTINKRSREAKIRIKREADKSKTCAMIVRFAMQVGCSVQDLFEVFVDKEKWCEPNYTE